MVRCILRNLGLLYGVSVPLFFVWEGTSGVLKRGQWPSDLSVGSFVFFALNLGIHLFPFAALQQFVLIGPRKAWSRWAKRATVLLSLLAFAPLFQWMGESLPFGLAVGVLVSTLLMRLPRDVEQQE